MNADSDNGGVNKNKSQANLMKGVSEGEVNQIQSDICDYHRSQKKLIIQSTLKTFDTKSFKKICLY